MEIKREKKELRAIYEAKLEQISGQEARQWSELICHYALTLPVLAKSKTVAAYASFDHEVNTDLLLSKLLEQGFTLTLPVVDRQRRIMEFRHVESLKDLTPGVYGIRTPESGRLCQPEEIDLLFVPGLAFDLQGTRLGRGGGYYDRYLPKIRTDAIKVGLAFQIQIAPKLPAVAHDIPVNALITQKGIILNKIT